VTTLHDWLSAEPFTLAMSSGFFGFFAHCGVVSALDEAALMPARLRGSSAGALIAGLWAAGMPAEDMRRELLELKRADFWDPGPGAGLLRGRLFGRRLRRLLPVQRFESCRVPLAVSVFDLGTLGTRVIDRGELAPAVQASCSFPVLFQPQPVEGRLCLDGGVLDRPGLQALGPSERLLSHHLSSRSPWRRKASPALRLPDRSNTTSLVIDGLPRLGPFRLGRGPQAIERARAATLRALASHLDAPGEGFSVLLGDRGSVSR
jgi:NTE family protein